MTLLSYQEETIIAQCTPSGRGAIALLRISGKQSIDIVDSISKLASGKSLLQCLTHTIHFGYIVDHNEHHIDQVLFLVMHAPRTFTGENTIEITCHNNPFIISDIITRAIQAGARLADNGEFTRRAVMNNKIDLLQAEAINELIHAHTTLALKHSLAQLEGSLSSWVVFIEERLANAQALCSASFEFLDDEISFGNQIKDIITSTRSYIQSVCTSFERHQHIRNGVRIAIIGTVNAGKSSLFNALLDKQRSIVTNIPGTTRDTVEAGLYKDGNYWTLIDTAGIRKTEDIIEQQGIDRSLHEANMADIIILVVDGSRTMDTEEQEFYQTCISQHTDKIILVRNKMDSATAVPLQLKMQCLDCSCTRMHNMQAIEDVLKTKITALFESMQSPYLLNERHLNILMSLDLKLSDIEHMLTEPIAYELVATHLTDALSHLCQLTGKSISERSMDLIFKQFCVGK